MQKINCNCGEFFEAEILSEIDITKFPDTVEKILEGNFMLFICPSCSKQLALEYQIRLYSNRYDIMMIPEINRDKILSGNLKPAANQLVIGFPELREKFLIFKCGYDERIIELLKLYLLEKTGKDSNISILFSGKGIGTLVFHIFGLKENETGVSNVPETIYNSIESSLEERLKDPDIFELLSLPYISVNKIIPEVQ